MLTSKLLLRSRRTRRSRASLDKFLFLCFFHICNLCHCHPLLFPSFRIRLTILHNFLGFCCIFIPLKLVNCLLFAKTWKLKFGISNLSWNGISNLSFWRFLSQSSPLKRWQIFCEFFTLHCLLNFLTTFNKTRLRLRWLFLKMPMFSIIIFIFLKRTFICLPSLVWLYFYTKTRLISAKYNSLEPKTWMDFAAYYGISSLSFCFSSQSSTLFTNSLHFIVFPPTRRHFIIVLHFIFSSIKTPKSDDDFICL